MENDKAIRATEKGMMSLISFNKLRRHSMLHNQLTESISKLPVGKF